MQNLLSQLAEDFPRLEFVSGSQFKWSPADKTIIYTDVSSEQSVWALFHELAHALLGHRSYMTDIELLFMEVAAWDKAKTIAKSYGHAIDEEHIQDCLDTYRDWLDQRSTCPACANKSLQQTPEEYRCFNCQTVWGVSSSRFCRPYRRLTPANSKPETLNPNQAQNKKPKTAQNIFV